LILSLQCGVSLAQETSDALPGNASAAPSSPTSDTEPRWIPSFEREDVHGVLWSRYLLRNTNHETDNDFYQTLYLDLGDARRDRFTFSFEGEWSADLDSRSNPSAFYSVEDTFQSHVNARVVQAYIDGNRFGPLHRVRVGRQAYSWMPEVVDFDGISVLTEPAGSWNLSAHALAGVPTHLYESPSSGDSSFGGGIEVEPTATTWASFDAVVLRDSLVTSTERNTLLAAAARQRFAREWSVAPRVTGVDDEFRDVDLNVSYAGLENGWTGQFSFYALVNTQRQLVTEIDPYFQILEERRPYDEWRLLLSKDLNDRWTIDGGLWFTELVNSNDEGAFNHDFRRYYLTPTLRDWPWDRMSLSATAEIWWTSDQQVWSYGFDATRRFSDTLRVSAGSEYQLFKFDPLLGGERENVEDLYLRVRWDITKSLQADVGTEFEWDSQDAYRILRLGLGWRF
jgi:hypothetical protein